MKDQLKLILITLFVGGILIYWSTIKESIVGLFDGDTQIADTTNYHNMKIKLDSLKFTSYNSTKYKTIKLEIEKQLEFSLISSIQRLDLLTLCNREQLDGLKKEIEQYLSEDQSGNSRGLQKYIRDYKQEVNNFDFTYYDNQIRAHDYYLNDFSNIVLRYFSNQQSYNCWDKETFDDLYSKCDLLAIDDQYRSSFEGIKRSNLNTLDRLFNDYGGYLLPCTSQPTSSSITY
jgi:hypothetical protein